MSPFQFNISSDGGSPIFTLAIVVMTLLNFLMALFWLTVGWRAMKAHERLPETLSMKLSAPSPETTGMTGEPSGPTES